MTSALLFISIICRPGEVSVTVYKYVISFFNIAIEQIYINYIPNDWNVVKITPNHFQKLVDVTAITLYVRSCSFLQDSVHCTWLTSYTWFYIEFYMCQTGDKNTKNTITSTNNICRLVECNSLKKFLKRVIIPYQEV